MSKLDFGDGTTLDGSRSMPLQLKRLIERAEETRGQDGETDALVMLGDFVRAHRETVIGGCQVQVAVEYAQGKRKNAKG